MKKLIILIGLFLSINAVAQSDKIEFYFCEQMLYKNTELLKLRIVHLKDTFYVPQIDANTFLNPITFYDINLDTSNNYIEMIFENCKYRYSIPIVNSFFYGSYLKICISKGKDDWYDVTVTDSYIVTKSITKRVNRKRIARH